MSDEDMSDVSDLSSQLGTLQMSEFPNSRSDVYDTPVKQGGGKATVLRISKIPKYSPRSALNSGCKVSPKAKDLHSGTPSKLPVLSEPVRSATLEVRKTRQERGYIRQSSSSRAIKNLRDTSGATPHVVGRLPSSRPDKENIFEKLSAGSKRTVSLADEANLRIPKIRAARPPLTQHPTISGLPRSRTLQSINSLTKELTGQRVSSLTSAAKMGSLKRKASTQPQQSKEPRVASVSDTVRSRKPQITSFKELFDRLEAHPSSRSNMDTYRDIFQHRVGRSGGFQASLLSQENPQLYESLTVYERGEITRKDRVYFVGKNKQTRLVVNHNKQFTRNFGFDDENKDYIVRPGDQLDYRYEILSKLGKGCFGSVVSCADHKTGKLVAVKIVKNNMDWILQSINEIKALKKLSQADPGDRQPVLKILDNFQFRSHICIVTDLLAVNLFQVIESSDFSGLSLQLVQKIAGDIVQALDFVHSHEIVHCDLKPENIMLIPSKNSVTVKLIDFGSSCPKDQLSYSYIQSRFYRAPEVAIGARYTTKIDIWSLGATLAELFTGLPLFPANNEFDLISMFAEYFGPPPKLLIKKLRDAMLRQGPIGVKDFGSGAATLDKTTLLWRGFSTDGTLDTTMFRERLNRKIHFSSKTLESTLLLQKTRNGRNHPSDPLVASFVEFLTKCFHWDPAKRASASTLASEQFFSQSK